MIRKTSIPRNARMIVYQATNQVNGKIYIGKTVRTLSHAKSRHHQRAKFGWKYGTDSHFYAAIRKYGWKSFHWDIIDKGGSDAEIQELERAWIAFTGSYVDRSIGYNLTPGGDGGAGKKLSAAQKAKLSKIFSGKGNFGWGKFGAAHPAFGHVKTPEGRAAIASAQRGRFVSPETRRKISEARIAFSAASKAETERRKAEERAAKRARHAAKKAAGAYKGENAGPSKVTNAQRAEICLRRAAGESYRIIAEDYPLQLTGVRAVCENWGPLNGYPFEKIVARSDHRSKLTDDQRRAILEAHGTGVPIMALAETYGVGNTTIYWTLTVWGPREGIPYVSRSGAWTGPIEESEAPPEP